MDHRPVGQEIAAESTGNLERMLRPQVEEPPRALFDA
jgi:hypothetical protein